MDSGLVFDMLPLAKTIVDNLFVFTSEEDCELAFKILKQFELEQHGWSFLCRPRKRDDKFVLKIRMDRIWSFVRSAVGMIWAEVIPVEMPDKEDAYELTVIKC